MKLGVMHGLKWASRAKIFAFESSEQWCSWWVNKESKETVGADEDEDLIGAIAFEEKEREIWEWNWNWNWEGGEMVFCV